MNRTSRASSEVRIAARSPLRSSDGPATVRIPTPSSSRMMYARLVFPSPGGPTSSTWSSASPRVIAAVSTTSSCAFSRSCPTNSARCRGRSERSNSSSAPSERRRERRADSLIPAPALVEPRAHAAFLQRLAHALLGREIRIDLGERPLGVEHRVAELDERIAGGQVVARRRPAARPGRSPIFSFSSSTTRCAVFLPIPGIASNRAVSSSTIARRSSADGRAGDDRERHLRPDAADRDQVLEQLALRRVGEPVELRARPRARRGTSRATTSSAPSARRSAPGVAATR